MTSPVVRRALTCFVAPAALALAAGSTGTAQSTISAQGFGYPPGQLSTHALGLGGANAELDPETPRNPAAVSSWGRPGLHVQYDPEFRRMSIDARTDRTMNARFPLISGALQLGPRLTAAASISTLLDRTWTTSVNATGVVSGVDLTTTTLFESAGGMNDVRLGLAWTVIPSFRVGIGGHVVTGENRVIVRTTFSSPAFLPLTQETETSYSGKTVSGGFTWRPLTQVAVGGSMRLEGSLRGRRGTETVTSARLPARYGATIAYTGIGGAILAVTGNWEDWAAVEGLGSEEVVPRSTQEIGLGAEVDGPRFRGSIVTLRGGGRWRDLPFAAAGSPIRERSVAGGVGVPLATIGGSPRAALDLALQRASRSGFPGADESSWTLSVGLTVRP
jgi:hypothetical protein